MKRKIPRRMRTYRRRMLWEAEYFAGLAGDDSLGCLAACAPAYRHLATLDRRQVRRLRRTGQAWL